MLSSREDHAFWKTHGLPAPGTTLSAEAFAALPETTILIEHIDGQVIYPHWSRITMSPTPRPIHQLGVGELHLILRDIIPNGNVLLAPMELLLSTQTVQPDLFWIAEESACVRDERGWLSWPA